MPNSRNVGGTGFVSLGDYLGANSDALDAQFANDSTTAHGIGDSFNQVIGLVPGEAEAPAQASGVAATPPPEGGTDPYSTAIGAAEKAQGLATQFGSQGGLAGAGANPTSGEQSFNAALLSGAHGQDYSSLSGYLGGFTPGSVDEAWNAGSLKGIGEYAPPAQPQPQVDNGTPGSTEDPALPPQTRGVPGVPGRTPTIPIRPQRWGTPRYRAPGGMQ